jgi:hypothetical protein
MMEADWAVYLDSTPCPDCGVSGWDERCDPDWIDAEDLSPWAYLCVVCGCNAVDAKNGYDTCGQCLAAQ